MSTLTSFEECDLVLAKCLQVAHEVYQFHRSQTTESHLQGRYSYYANCRHHVATTMSRAKELGPYSTGRSANSFNINTTNTNIENQAQQHQQPLPLLVKANRHFANEFERDCAFILHQNINNPVAAVEAESEESPVPVVVLRDAALPNDASASSTSRGTVPCLLYRWRDPKCARLFHRVMQRCLDESAQLMLPPPFHAAGGGFPCSKIAYQGTVVSVVVLPPLVRREAIASTATISNSTASSSSSSSTTGCGIFALKTFAAALSPMLYSSTLDMHVKNAPSVFAIPAALLLPTVSAYAAGGGGSNDVMMLPDKISMLSQIVSQQRQEPHQQQEYHLLLRPELEKYITEEENNNITDGMTTTSTGVIISQTLDKAARRVAFDLLIHFEKQILSSSSSSTSSQQNQNNQKNDETITSIVNVSLAKNEISKIFHNQGVNLKLMYLVSCHLESILAIDEHENKNNKNQNVTLDSISCSKLALGAEMIARTIKSMVRKRTETSQLMSSDNNKSDESSIKFLSTLQNVFNDFLTDRIFYRELLQPAMRKKFGCPDGFFVDREKLTSLIGGVAALVARGLGCGLEEDMKTFIIYKPTTTTDIDENNTQNGDDEFQTPATSSIFFSPQNLGKVTSSGICPDLTFLTSLLSPAKEIHQIQQQQQQQNGSPNRNNNHDNSTSYLFVHLTSTMAQLTASMSPRNPVREQPDDATNSNVTGVNAVLCFLEAARILKFCFCETLKFRGSDGNYQKQSDTINRNNNEYSSTAGCVSGLSIVFSELEHRIRRGGGGGGNSSFNHNSMNNNNTSNMSAASSSSSRGSASRLKRCLAVWLLSLLGGCFSSVANQQQNIIVRNSNSSPAVVVNLPSLCRSLVSEFVVTFRPTSSSSSSNSFELVSSLLCSINFMKILTEDFNFSSSSGTSENDNTANNFYYYYSTFSQHEKSEIICNVLADLLAFAARIGKLLPPPTSSSFYYYFPTSPFLLYGKPSSNENDHSENNNNNLLLSHTFFQCLETCSKIIESLVSTTTTTTSTSPLVSKQNNSSVSISPRRLNNSDINLSLNNNNNSSVFSSKDMLTLLAPGLCGFIWNILLWNLRGVTETEESATSDHNKSNKTNSTNRHNNSNDSSSFISSKLLRPSPTGYIKSNDNDVEHNDDTNFWALGFDIIFFQPLFSQKIPTLVKRSKETNFSFQSIMDSTLYHQQQNNNNNRFNSSHVQQLENGNNTLVSAASSWWLDVALFALTTTFPQLVHLTTNGRSNYCNELLTRVIIILVGVFTNSANTNHHLNSGITVLASLLDPQAAKIFPALIQSNANNNINHDDDVNFGKISEIIENSRNMMSLNTSGGEKILTPRQRQQQFQQKQNSDNNNNNNNNQNHNDPYRALLSESLRIILLTSSQLPVESSNAVKYNRFVPVSMTSRNVAAFKTVLDLFSASPKNENNKNNSSSRNSNHHRANMMMTLASTRSHSGNRNTSYSTTPSSARNNHVDNSVTASDASSSKSYHEKVRDLLVEYTETLASSLPAHMTNFGESLFGLWSFYFKKKDVILASSRSHNTNNNFTNNDANTMILYEISKWRRSNFANGDNNDDDLANENNHPEKQKSLSQLRQDATQDEITDRMVLESEESFDRKRIHRQIADLTASTLLRLAADARDDQRTNAAVCIQHAQRLRVARTASAQSAQQQGRALQQQRTEEADDQVLDEERTYAALRLQTLQRKRAAKDVAAGRRAMLESGRNVVARDSFDAEREFATLKLQSAARQNLARRRVGELRERRRLADEAAYVRDSPKHDDWDGDMVDQEGEKERDIQEGNDEEAVEALTEEELEEQQRAALKLQSLQRQRMAKQRVVTMKLENEQKQQQRQVDNLNAAQRSLEEATEEVARAEIEQNQAEEVAGFRKLLKLLRSQEQYQKAQDEKATHNSSDDEDANNNNNSNANDAGEDDQTGAALRIQSAQRQRAAKTKVNHMRALKGQAQRQNEIFEGEEKVARDEIRLEEASDAAKHRMLMNLLKKNPELSKNNTTQKSSSTKTGSDEEDEDDQENNNNVNDISVTSGKDDGAKNKNSSSPWSYMRHEQDEHVSRSRERARSEPRSQRQEQNQKTHDEELLSEADRLADLQKRVADFEKERHIESEAKQLKALQNMVRELEAEKQFHQDVLELLDIEGEMRRSIEDCERRMKRFMRLPTI